MYLPPPIDLRLKLDCPYCHRLTPARESTCHHCDEHIPAEFQAREIERLEARRRRHLKLAAIILPALLLLLMLLFDALGLPREPRLGPSGESRHPITAPPISVTSRPG